MPRKKRIKYTRKLGKYIAEQIEAGSTLADVLKNHTDKEPKLPARRTINLWQESYPEFKETMDFAYQCWLQLKLDELDYVSTASIKVLYPNLTPEEMRDGYEARRSRMDALKFMLAKMGPVLSKRWDKATTPVLTTQGTQIVIMNYNTQEPKLVKERPELLDNIKLTEIENATR